MYTNILVKLDSFIPLIKAGTSTAVVCRAMTGGLSCTESYFPASSAFNLTFMCACTWLLPCYIVSRLLSSAQQSKEGVVAWSIYHVGVHI